MDHRAFLRINIADAELIHVPWIPSEKGESLQSYAKRLYDQTQPDRNCSVIGVSFGGMIAQEWYKISAPRHLVLISTTHDRNRIRPFLRVPGKLGLNRLLHPSIAVFFSPISNALFGAKTKEDKQLLKAILRDANPKFLRWATGALLQWNSEKVKGAIYIHGSHDKIIAAPEKIDLETDGGHFTVFTQGDEISQFLHRILIAKSY
ncbi:hypothetical protein OAK35_01765 [Crocinitomicaceae bacterium]|nr:hypothetical protein [Crocinitomicaceae bacterium]